MTRIRRLAIAAASATLATAAIAPDSREETSNGAPVGGDGGDGLPRRSLYNYYIDVRDVGRKPPRLFQSGKLRNRNANWGSGSNHVTIDVNVNINDSTKDSDYYANDNTMDWGYYFNGNTMDWDYYVNDSTNHWSGNINDNTNHGSGSVNDNTKYEEYYWATSCPDGAWGWGTAHEAATAHQRQRPQGGTHWPHQEPVLQQRQQGYGHGLPAQADHQTGYQTGYQTSGHQNPSQGDPRAAMLHARYRADMPQARTSGGGDQRRRLAKSSKKGKSTKTSKSKSPKWTKPTVEWGWWSSKSAKKSKGKWDTSWGGGEGKPNRGWNMVKCPLPPVPPGPPTTARPNTPGEFWRRIGGEGEVGQRLRRKGRLETTSRGSVEDIASSRSRNSPKRILRVLWITASRSGNSKVSRSKIPRIITSYESGAIILWKACILYDEN